MLKETISDLDNDQGQIDEVQLGAPSGLDAGDSGTFYLDNFESRRQNYIGLDPEVPFSDLIFADGFESGDLSAWSEAETDGGDLSASAAAALNGSYGLQMLVDDDTALYVLDRSPMAETRYRARFYLDPNSMAMEEWDRFELLLDSNWYFNVNMGDDDGVYILAASVNDDSDSGFDTADYEISDAWHAVEIEWAAASSPGMNDGYLTLWIDGVLKETLSGLDTDEERISEVQLGVPADLDSGDSGTFYIDAFESRRSDYIGLLAYEGGHYKLAAPAGRRAAQEESTSTPTPTETPTPTSTGTETPTPTSTETVTPTPTVSPTSPLMLMGLNTPTEPPPAALVSAQYIYDGDNNLVKAVVNGVVTYYPGRHYNLEVDGETETVKKFYAVGGLTVAVRTISGEDDTLNWVLSDHLGSLNVTANEDGSWNSEIRYTAFGEVRWKDGITPTEYRFTGQLEQAELGLYYYVARWYDPTLAHFISADTIIPDPGNPITYNRYAYTRNNPIRYNDPIGHDVGCPASNPACTKLSGYGNEDRAKAYDEHVAKFRQMYRETLQKTGLSPLIFPQLGSNLYPGMPNPQAEAQKIPLSYSVEKPLPSISSWTPPENWDLEPSHPDYNASTINYYFISSTYTVDRYGGEYIGFGLNFGKGIPFSFSHNKGLIKTADDMMPMPSDVEKFLTGPAFGWSVGAGGDLAKTWSPGAGDRVSHTSSEYGALIGVSIGISGIYNIKIR